MMISVITGNSHLYTQHINIMSNNPDKVSAGAWIQYTLHDFINRVESLALKHDVKITRLDKSKKQIYFDCNYFEKVKFSIDLTTLVQEFKVKAPGIFKTMEVVNVIKTIHGWVPESRYLSNIYKKEEEDRG